MKLMDFFDRGWRYALAFCLRRDNSSGVLHLAFAFFALVSLFLSLYHTPWCDEAQAWLLARDLTVWDLFKEARHDGHPILWHLCLKLIQALGANYLGMMFLNWAFMAFAVWLLFYRSTLPLLARIVVALCPTCLWQISFNARNYAIAAALIFLAAVLYREIEKRRVLFSVVLALLASTNVYAAAVFVGIGFQFLLEQAYGFGQARFSLRPLYTRYFLPNIILAIGAFLLVAQLAPVPLPGEPTVGRPTLSVNFTYLTRFLSDLVFLMPLALACLVKRPGCPRIYGGIPTVGLALIPTLFYACGSRHAFMIVLELVYFIWIYLPDLLRPGAPPGDTSGRSKLALVTAMIVISCFACQWGGIRTAFKYTRDSRHTGEAIIKNNLDRPTTLLVTTDPVKASSLLLFFKNIRAAYGPPPYRPDPESFADFFYTRLRTKIPTLEEMKPLVLNLARENPGKTILVVSSDPINDHFDDHDPAYRLVPVYSSPAPEPFHYDDEFYQVYLLK